MHELLVLLVAAYAVGVPSAIVLIRAVQRLHRDDLPLSQVLPRSSISLGALWLVGWLVLSAMDGMLFWAPIATIPVGAPLTIILGNGMVDPDENVNARGAVEYSYGWSAYRDAGYAIVLGGYILQLGAAMYQIEAYA